MRQSQIIVCLKILRIEDECPPVILDCRIELALHQEQSSKIIVGIGKIRSEPGRFKVMTYRLFDQALIPEHIPQIAVRIGKFGLALDRLAELSGCLVQLSLRPESEPQIVVPLDIIRLECKHLFILPDRFIEPALCMQRSAHLVMRIGAARLDQQRLLKAFECRIQFPLRPVGGAQITIHGAGGFYPYRPANQVDGSLPIACLVGDHAEQMQRRRMVWIHPQNLPVAGLGLRQTPRAVMLQGETAAGLPFESLNFVLCS